MAILRFDELAKLKDVMFHVTPKKNLKSIMAKGLVPSKKARGDGKDMLGYVPNSIYFSPSAKAARLWLLMLTGGMYKDADVEAIKNYVILKVNVSKWLSKFKRDPDSPETEAWYLTGVTIPPKNIEVVQVSDKVADRIKKADAYSWPHEDYGYSEKQLVKFIEGLEGPERTRMVKDFEGWVKHYTKIYTKEIKEGDKQGIRETLKAFKYLEKVGNALKMFKLIPKSTQVTPKV